MDPKTVRAVPISARRIEEGDVLLLPKSGYPVQFNRDEATSVATVEAVSVRHDSGEAAPRSVVLGLNGADIQVHPTDSAWLVIGQPEGSES